MSGAGKNILNRLRRGLPPTTATYYVKIRDDAERDTEHHSLHLPPSATDAANNVPLTNTAVQTTCEVIYEADADVSDLAPSMLRDVESPPRETMDQPAAASSTSSPPASSSTSPYPAPSPPTPSRQGRAQSDDQPSGSTASPSNLLSLGVDGGLRPRPRYRIRGKQTIPSHDIEYGSGPATGAATCSRSASATPWSRRIGFIKIPLSHPCNSCSSPTRTTCSLCRRSLCLHCAKARRLCRATD